MTTPLLETVEVRTVGRRDLDAALPRWAEYVGHAGPPALAYHPAWLKVLSRGLGHDPYVLEARDGAETLGVLPLTLISSTLFGRYLVGLPYLNSGGVIADGEAIARRLIDRAVGLADELGVRHLELRHERAVAHTALSRPPADKVHMRLSLPASAGLLWDSLAPKVRNQVRKGQKAGLEVSWGGEGLLGEFYDVFSRNMRDLGTPVFGLRLFREVLRQFPGLAELCVVRSGGRAVAAALLTHGRGVTEVPSASSLRRYNNLCANMMMYWCLLERAVERGQSTFDFGRSNPGSGTYNFKRQWGARPSQAEWQFYVRRGDCSDMRPDNPRYRLMIRLWQRLPVPLTRLIGPPIVRGIP